MVRTRVRLRFGKQGDLRWIGHRDLARCFERWFRRAGLPLAMSEGFHPKPRMSFPLALAVGIEGADEVMELELTEGCGEAELHRRLARYAPAGLSLRAIEVLPPGAKKAQVRRVAYEIRVPEARAADVAERIRRIDASVTWPVNRPNRSDPVDLRATWEHGSLSGGVLCVCLRQERQACAGPREVLAALGLADLEQQGTRLIRSSVELAP